MTSTSGRTATTDMTSATLGADTPFGRVSHVVPAAELSETPARWTRPAVPLGTDPPVWPEAE